jgi:hypothetical protein
MKQPSRIEQARRRLRTTRLYVGLGSAAAFAAFGVVARVAHPGGAHAATTAAGKATAAVASTSAGDSTQSTRSTSFFGAGSVSSSSAGDSSASAQTTSSGS